MKYVKHLVAAAALAAAFGAQAEVAGSLGGGTGTFLGLSSAGLDGGSVATLSGGSVYSASQSYAAMPTGNIFGGEFLAAGAVAGPTAVLNFAGSGVDNISFLWGSPDTYNSLIVTTTGGVTQTFNTVNLDFRVSDGNQTFAQYVQFSALDGTKITSLTFTNSPNMNAFEVANFNVAAPVPEPETYALMLAGLGVLGFVARRRRRID